MLLDSNIIIYAAQPKHEQLRKFIAEHAPAVSAISYVEVLGYHKLNDREREYLLQFFNAAEILHITQLVLDRAVSLRQRNKMSLGDALVAATALVHDLTLLTHNVDDFKRIKDLKLLDPLAWAS